MPLSLQYDVAEPNSAWNWLERWSFSHFWELCAQTKKTADAKPQRKQSCMLTVETEAGELKMGVRKVVAANNGGNRALASFEQGKLKNNSRKITSHRTESVQEQAQNELERVKRNLRKVSASMAVASEKETENQHQSPKEVSSFAAPNVFKQEITNSPPKLVDMVVNVDKTALKEAPPYPLTADEQVNATHDDHPAVELHALDICGNMETLPAVYEELSSKEEHNSKEKVKMGRRKSLPAKQEYPENASQNTLSLPSYMAATESAKAKLRAQGSSKIDDVAENGFERRHSLPAPTNGKLSSLSPRMQKPVLANGKGGSKKSRSLVSSRDGKRRIFIIFLNFVYCTYFSLVNSFFLATFICRSIDIFVIDVLERFICTSIYCCGGQLHQEGTIIVDNFNFMKHDMSGLFSIHFVLHRVCLA